MLSGWYEPPGRGLGGRALTIYVDAASDQMVRAEDVYVTVLPCSEDEAHEMDVDRFLADSGATMHELLG